jgi:flagellar secretion chaperone FliS
MTRTGAGTYQTVGTLTADPARLILMLFDGASRFLQKARRALERGDVGEFSQALSRAHAIIGELANTLNPEAGGAVVEDLTLLYRFMLIHLTEGLIAKDPAHIDRVLGLLSTLREGFEGAIESERGATAS